MTTALLIVRLVLTGVFLVAGLAKLADLKGSRQAMTDFGLPDWLARPLGVLLPLAELAVAGTLLPAATAWWGATGALALLLVFVLGIAINLARGRKPDCHCFGQIHSAPAGPATLARNGVLAALAGLLVWAGPALTAPLARLSAAEQAGLALGLVALALLAALGALLTGLLSQNGRLLLRVEALEAAVAESGRSAPAPAASRSDPAPTASGLAVGSPAPAFSLPGLRGETLTLDALRAGGRPVLLVFSDPGCGPCTALLPDLARWQRDHAGAITLALVSRGTAEANARKIGDLTLSHVLLQTDREVAQSFRCHGTPGAVLVNADGTVGSPLAMGADAIKALAARAAEADPMLIAQTRAPGECGCKVNGHAHQTAPKPRSQGVPVGDPSPAFTLPDMTDQPVSLEDFRGRKTVLLFWNPGCGFCRRMADDLKAWEAAPPADAPRLMIVSTGSVEANAALGLKSPTVLDDSFRVGPSYGAGGTPMAVLVDEAGSVASPTVAGAPAVMEMLGVARPVMAGR